MRVSRGKCQGTVNRDGEGYNASHTIEDEQVGGGTISKEEKMYVFENEYQKSQLDNYPTRYTGPLFECFRK